MVCLAYHAPILPFSIATAHSLTTTVRKTLRFLRIRPTSAHHQRCNHQPVHFFEFPQVIFPCSNFFSRRLVPCSASVPLQTLLYVFPSLQLHFPSVFPTQLFILGQFLHTFDFGLKFVLLPHR
ncbi:unnamed protein product [Linum tenue]|uniref:Uncharacterized protein n=1 Tax=Linum tenue TaxID=586396 RepID=A0AAV0R7D8_9ROSI|nr:unnamed protein product [Linum tenue]